MEQNIKYLKLILPLNRAWFWLGIWLLYYLRVTDYAGVGLLEATMFFIGFAIEIPTGAISDLLGKKVTLVSSFFFYGLGNLIMGFADSYELLFLSVFTMVVGGALYSGTAEALTFDSLKAIHKEEKFEHVLSTIETRSLIALSLSGILGGFLYSVDIHFPFFATAVSGFLGAIFILLFVSEPPIDTEKFSLRNYLRQNKEGMKHLFNEAVDKTILLRLILIGSFIHIFDNVMDSALPIDYGFNEKQLGIIAGVLPLIAAFGSFIYPKFKKKIKRNSSLLIFALIYFISAAISPYLGMAIGTLSIATRAIFEPALNILTSDTLNRQIESRYRATALSTFSMIKSLPYISVAYFIGSLIDKFSATNVAGGLGTLFAIIFITTFLPKVIKKENVELNS